METKEHLIDLESTVKTKVDIDQQPGDRLFTPFFSPLWLCLLIALLVRIWLVIHTNGVIDGDEALVGIQAQHILQGEHPLYFYGQPYMGSLEAYIVALLFAITGSSVWILRAEPILLSLVVVWLTWKFAGALAELAKLPSYAQRIFMTIAALLAAIPPLYDTVLELRTLGGYVETFALMLLLLYLALRLTQRWHAGVSYKELALRWAVIGFIVGLGLWINPLILSAVLAAGIWIAGFCAIEIVQRRKQVSSESGGSRQTAYALSRPLKGLLLAAVAIPMCIIGLTLALIWGARHNWANITYVRNLGGDLSIKRLSTIYHVTKTYITCVSPRLIGGGLPNENTLLTTIHSPLVFIGVFCISFTAALIALSFLWHHPLLLSIRLFAAFPTIFAACTAFAFCVGSASKFILMGCNLDFAGRYASPFMLSLPFFFTTVLTLASMLIYEWGKSRQIQQEKSPLRSGVASRSPLFWLGQAILLTFMLAYLGAQAWTYGQTDPGYTFQSPYCRLYPANNDPIIAYMQHAHIHYFWASNLLAYPIVFKTNSSIIGADPTPLRNPKATNRIPAYTNAVLHADRPSMLVMIRHGDPDSRILRLLKARNITYQAAVFPSQPGFDILVVTPISHTVSPLEPTFLDFFYCTLAS